MRFISLNNSWKKKVFSKKKKWKKKTVHVKKAEEWIYRSVLIKVRKWSKHRRIPLANLWKAVEESSRIVVITNIFLILIFVITILSLPLPLSFTQPSLCNRCLSAVSPLRTIDLFRRLSGLMNYITILQVLLPGGSHGREVCSFWSWCPYLILSATASVSELQKMDFAAEKPSGS